MSAIQKIAQPGSLEIRTVREFAATPDRIFRAYTDPLAIPRWWGPAYLTTTVDKLEARSGGFWRFLQKDPEGNDYNFHGVFHLVEPHSRLIFTFEWESLPGHVLLETIQFEALPNQTTRLTDSLVFQTVEDRDGMLAAGMDEGGTESDDRINSLLREGFL